MTAAKIEIPEIFAAEALAGAIRLQTSRFERRRTAAIRAIKFEEIASREKDEDFEIDTQEFLLWAIKRPDLPLPPRFADRVSSYIGHVEPRDTPENRLVWANKREASLQAAVALLSFELRALQKRTRLKSDSAREFCRKLGQRWKDIHPLLKEPTARYHEDLLSKSLNRLKK
ncbi:MAG: hypothetical protein KDD60_12840 [Bdellovibrionales bacterium]|nr:hypothetical protein [Bdellovibrionales bacterium]